MCRQAAASAGASVPCDIKQASTGLGLSGAAAERDEYGEFGGGRTLKDTASSLECNCMWREAQRVACNAATLAKSGEEPAHRATREAKT